MHAKYRRKYVSQARLRTRGWTESIISKLNLLPDMTKPNPYGSKAPPLKLYSIERLEEIENTEEFKALMERSKSFKAAGAKALETRKQRLMAYAKTVDIKIDYVPEPKLTHDAIKAFNHMNGAAVQASTKCSSTDLQHIRDIYIRRELTNYEDIITHIKGCAGIKEIYPALESVIHMRITEEWNQKAGVMT